MKIIKTIFLLFIVLFLSSCSSWIVITDAPETTTIEDMQETINNTIDDKYKNIKNNVALSNEYYKSDYECNYHIYNDDFYDENICISTTKNTIKNLYNTSYYNDCIKHIKFCYYAADETLLYIITLKNFANFSNDFDNIQDYLQIHNAHIMINGHY